MKNKPIPLTEREFQIMNVAIQFALDIANMTLDDPNFGVDFSDIVHRVTDRLPFEVSKEDIESLWMMEI